MAYSSTNLKRNLRPIYKQIYKHILLKFTNDDASSVTLSWTVP